MEAPTPTMVGRLKPAGGRVLATEFPADDEQRHSGLIVPAYRVAEDVIRAVIVRSDHADFVVGEVVYFREHGSYGCAAKIQDVWVIEPEMILAVEE